MRIGNWEAWKDRGSEERYEFTASNGVVLRLYEQFDEEYSVTTDGRTCSTDLDSPTKWKYDDTGEPVPEDEYLMPDTSASQWRAEAYVNDECVEVTGQREQPDAQAQLLEVFERIEDPEIAAAGREALADWNARRPDQAGRPKWFGHGTLADPAMRGYPLEWE